MDFKTLITSHQWLSVELTILNLYPDQKDIIEEYKKVFRKLQILNPIKDEMLIVLTEYESDADVELNSKSTYVDISGRKEKLEPNQLTDSYALEFVKWENWLGMNLAPETIDNFNGLEIISHCLFEMTFCGYEQDEIQEKFDSIKKSIDEYESLSKDEKKQKTISLEDLKKRFNSKGSG